jgi:Flp pilus assembly protein TadD
MKRDAPAQPPISAPECRPRRRGRTQALVMMALALGACSNSRPAANAHREISLRVADAALASGVPELALRVADLAIAKDPRDPHAQIARGDALYAMGQRDMARTSYRAALAIDPTMVGGQVGLGRTLVQSDPRAAEAAFVAALAYEPDNVIALNNLGVSRDMQGRNAEAQDAYRHALTVSPESTDVQVNLGMSLALSGHAGEAVPLLRGIAADPGAAQAWRKELVAALSVAGDARWAHQTLDTGSAPPDTSAIAAAAVPPSPVLAAADRNAVAEPRPTAPEAAREPSKFTGLSKAKTLSVLESAIAVAPASISVPSPDAAPRKAVAAADLPPIVPTAGAVPPVATGQGMAVGAHTADPLSTRTVAAPVPPDAAAAARALSSVPPGMQVAASRPMATEPVDEPGRSATLATAPYVQVASLFSEPDAMFEWHRLDKRMPDLLNGREPTVTRTEVHGRIYWRLRTFGFASMDEARDLCGRLKTAGLGCWSGLGL